MGAWSIRRSRSGGADVRHERALARMSPGFARGDVLSLFDDLDDELRGPGGAVKVFYRDRTPRRFASSEATRSP